MPTLPTFTSLGSGPTLLMLHGLGGGHAVFAPQMEAFAAMGYRAVAWDMPGYGQSEWVDPYTFTRLALSCITLIEVLVEENASHDNGHVVLLGHSMGGMVAQEVVAQRPDLVGRLILCATSAGFATSDDAWRARFIAQRLESLDAGNTMGELARDLLPLAVGPAAAPEGLQLAIDCMARLSDTTYRHAVHALSSFDRFADLAHIQVPSLLVAGEVDKTAPPRLMKKMAQAIQGSQYVELPGVGHIPQLEAPQAFNAAVRGFLDQRHPVR